MTKIRFWLQGVRLYIAFGIILVTLETAWWAVAAYGANRMALNRTQEVYAWTALILLLLALSIGPLLKLVPTLPGKQQLRDARRLIGVGAAWFATLHAVLTYFYLFQAVNPLRLADTYRVSFGLGTFGLIILLLLAFTSFDKAFKSMGIWWFRLHRLIYIAVLVSVLHAFMIGTHAVGLGVLIGLLIMGLLLSGAYIYLYFIKSTATKLQLITVVYLVLLAAAILNYGLTQHLGYNILTGNGRH